VGREALTQTDNPKLQSRIAPSLFEDIERNGFTVVSDLLEPEFVILLTSEVSRLSSHRTARLRNGQMFAVRDLRNALPIVEEIANRLRVCALVEPMITGKARLVRAIFFDKVPAANWKVGWHQVVTITVKQRVDVDGFTAWSKKGGVVHVNAPAAVLQNIITLRLHLDAADEGNGALKVIPGSHRLGKLSPREIGESKARSSPVACSVPAGGALAMRPLLIHASSPSLRPDHRRVIHLEFSGTVLPGGLEWHGS
jgi:ectoine hydroxylase-related dioxygenase (phytanoyl-CoA dioxygenase family)